MTPTNIIKRKSILIVEDDEYSSRLFSEVLKESGYELVFCKSAEASIDIVKENKQIDLVLMDIKLPGKNGLYATKKIKSIRKDLPIIAQTAYIMLHGEKVALEGGCDAYLSKPIIIKDLISAIEKLI